MSVNLYYKPITPIDHYYVNVTACQVRDDLTSLYGGYPIILTKDNIPELETLRRLWRGRDLDCFDKDPYGEIIKIIKSSKDGIELFEDC